MNRYLLGLWTSALIFVSRPAWACDPCALYNISKLQAHDQGSVSVSLSQQYSDFARTSPYAERMGEFVQGYSTTQFGVSYDITSKFGLQASLPLIYRGFDKVDNFQSKSDSETGIGDAALIGNYTFAKYREDNWSLLASFTGGVKFPTGDTGTLNRIANATERLHSKHHVIAGANGGRALSLGTGSYDYIMGLSSLSRFYRTLFLANAQYTIRTEGAFNYEFADDFVWSAGPGAYLLLEDERSLAVQVALSGEHKGVDRLNGAHVSGSEISNLYVGPAMIFTIGGSIVGEVGLDFRVSHADSNSTVVPEYRVRSGVTYRVRRDRGKRGGITTETQRHRAERSKL